jgi:NAD(P)-dependent dehydrogenase (short-subunit alcohol dehydrogenase family)
MELNLDAAVVLVTGANSGIGLATTKAFAAEGGRVVAGDLSVSELETLGEDVVPVQVDLATATGPARLVEQALERFGRVDVLVNNVGVAKPHAGFLEIPDRQWHEILEVNLLSMVRACRAAIPAMAERGKGVIVSLASDFARQPESGFSDYAASKAAILVTSKAIANEFGPRGIRSLCISPGPVLTPVWTEPGGFGETLAKQHGFERFEDVVEHFVTTMRPTPLRRLAEPEEVAALIVFLSSDAARHVTGTTVAIDGGGLRAIP